MSRSKQIEMSRAERLSRSAENQRRIKRDAKFTPMNDESVDTEEILQEIEAEERARQKQLDLDAEDANWWSEDTDMGA